MSMHRTGVEREKTQLSGDNIMVCTRDDNYPNHSYPTELVDDLILVLLTSMNLFSFIF